MSEFTPPRDPGFSTAPLGRAMPRSARIAPRPLSASSARSMVRADAQGPSGRASRPAGPDRLDRAVRPATRTLDPERLGDHVDRLYRAAWAMCGDAHDAEDLVQETFARLLTRPRRVREASELGYLLTALRNTYINGFRARRRRPQHVGLESFDVPSADPQQQPEAQVHAREVFALLHRLPDDLGAAIVAVDVVGLSVAEAAAAVGQQPKALERHLARARISVARQLAPDRAAPRTAT